MASHTHSHQTRSPRATERLFVGLSTAIFIALSLTAAYSVWAAYH
jgi:hypothetical protein